ncbi:MULTISPECIES: type II toxin-antitoxin system death-on-curing family toxin [Brevundimonas]|jgi:death-on-curing protein|uniref:Death-on-curing protein n=1 Tax=Brevundimonas halotolerans TaxID=69670 RepID=A0A7W9A1U7_9CAUL|nr:MULTISPECIES: type II toxin-antitoxin system death-on-curing family toxin [Brevundimonas]MAL87581.1 type II toxin-antitoxin system death-on-curing family toxin [Brevundimonas sp.]MBB5659625.1 death-on-curing protein [Brevundimonas halotolerans]HAJ02154.1 type II toxin-antitoxin system death-on-curing family toxin [Brevundimonas sp.]HAV51163.1 type II toxin-antitoxin system death-on-curing family toxin [Brevundimonas sp.]|tara:strand:+ start:4448 stop:4843 length:396 start_codon:yes stop_codon:yes gene_type:complete
MTAREPVWIRREALVSLHDRTLALHGGPAGIRDEGLLESALQRPINRFLYQQVTDLSVLAGTYAVGIASNHPFIDGNKRAAYQALLLFLALNGQPLQADSVDATLTMRAVAAGQIDIDPLARWIRANSSKT